MSAPDGEKEEAKAGGDDKGALDGLGVSMAALGTIENDFHNAMLNLSAEDNLERFRLEYEKLHRALKKSHESEKRLIKKCTDLNAEIVANATKVQTALKLSQEDQNTIVALKKEIEKAWKMVDAAHEKETRAKETIQQLKKEISNLALLVEQGAGITVGQENTVRDLIRIKDELAKDRDLLQNQTLSQKNELQAKTEEIRRLTQETQTKEEALTALQDKFAQQKRELETETKKRERNDRELKELNLVLQNRMADIRQKTLLIGQGLENIQKLEHNLKEEKTRSERFAKEFDLLNNQLEANKKSLEEEIAANSALNTLNTQAKADLNLKDYEISQLKAQQQKLMKAKDAQQKAVKRLENDKQDIERSKDQLRGTISTLDRQLDQMKRQEDSMRKSMDELQRERDILNRHYLKSQSDRQHVESDLKVMDNKKKNLEQELAGHRQEANAQRKLIYSLEQEIEKYSLKASEATAKYHQAMEEVKIGQMKVIDYQKQIDETNGKLKVQQNLYEQVRSDRNLYSKNLIEAQDEINEMKRKFKIMSHQIEQLKEEIGQKEKALVNEHYAQKKMEKQVEKLKNRIQSLETAKEAQTRKILGLDQEIHQLGQIITDCDAERAKQRKKLNHVMNERDILGTQLIRRNDELALLYEKIRIQQSTLNKGEVQYRDRLVDIRMLRLKIQELKRNLHITQARVRNVEELKKQINTLQRQLMHERNKVKALSEELENPMNVHRWRKLEGSDPKEHEMIQKIQTLQKRLISKTEECVEKDLLIQEKEKLYVELKNILSRQPGPEVAEQLNIYHENLRKRNVQMKHMAAELNMASTQTSNYKYENERLTRELHDTKKRYFEQKSRNHLLNQERSLVEQTSKDAGTFPLQHPPGQARYAGGGFSLST
ncbi:Cilia- and flagella-associated protein 58 [Diplonema papillatum]|nr:Cilia- and flagella-associated protein 58 [Diplonema papillatum]